MSPQPTELMVQVVGRLPLFKGFSPTQVRLVLGVCQHRVLDPGTVLCKAGTPADALHILVAGALSHLSPEGQVTGTVLPVATVGEGQFLNGRPQPVTVEAGKSSHVFTIPRFAFERLMRRDADAQLKLYRNLVDLLAVQLSPETQEAQRAAEQARQQEYESRIAVLERQLGQQTRKFGVALELLADRSELTRDEAEFQVLEQLRGLLPRVLIVDDEPDFRRFVREALVSFMVVEAGSGREALRIVEEEQLDLIIADIRMPEMDGCTLLTNLRSKFPSVPVLATSGYLDADDLQRYGFDGFIDKPVGVERLQAVVETALSKTN